MTNGTCCICKTELAERWHINKRDYCAEHKPAPSPGVWDESVRGTIIGGDGATRYQFWTTDGARKIAETDARWDSEAIEWFKTNYPERLAAGAEMRAML